MNILQLRKTAARFDPGAAQWSKGMAQPSPELVERFVQERDQRRKLIAACSGIDHPWPQKLCDLASHRLDWIERWCNLGGATDLPDWSVTLADINQRIEEANFHIGSLRAAESAVGKDHATSTEMLKIAYVAYFPDPDRIWRKTQINQRLRDIESFDAIFDVWARENGFSHGSLIERGRSPEPAVEEGLRMTPLTMADRLLKRLKPAENASEWEHRMWAVEQKHRAEIANDHNPATLPEIYSHVAKQTGKGASTLRRSVDRFCKTAPHLVLCNLEKGRLEHDPIIHSWVQFMLHQKT